MTVLEVGRGEWVGTRRGWVDRGGWVGTRDGERWVGR